MHIRRVAQPLSPLELGGIEFLNRLIRSHSNTFNISIPCLDDNLSGPVGTAAAAGQLQDEREGLFLGAELRELQRQVGIDYGGKRDIREMMALGDHLRAEENTTLGGAEFLKDAGAGAI